MQRVREFFEDIDGKWKEPTVNPIELKLIGSAALMVLTSYERGTKDSDVLETQAIRGSTKDRLVELAGPGTTLHKRHRMYLDIVGNGVPFMPHGPKYHAPSALNADLKHFRVAVLDVVDVVVSKLKRYSRDDRDDINEMIRRGHVTHAALIARFQAAVDEFWCDARAEDLPKYLKNLHQVERNAFGVEGTEVELPSWAAD